MNPTDLFAILIRSSPKQSAGGVPASAEYRRRRTHYALSEDLFYNIFTFGRILFTIS